MQSKHGILESCSTHNHLASITHTSYTNLAGINITAFTTALLEQRRLDACLYDAVVKLIPAGESPEDEEMLVAAGFAAFNQIYGKMRGRSEAAGYLMCDDDLFFMPERRWYSNRVLTRNPLLFHLLGDEYVEFSRFWHASNPESTMAFPGILKTIKQRSMSRFPRLVEED